MLRAHELNSGVLIGGVSFVSFVAAHPHTQTNTLATPPHTHTHTHTHTSPCARRHVYACLFLTNACVCGWLKELYCAAAGGDASTAAALRSRTRREQQQPQGAEKEEGGSDSGSASDSDGDSEDESGHGDLEDVCVLGVSGWGEEGRSWSSESSTCSPERERGDAEATLSQEMERTLRSQPVTSILRDPGERALPLRQVVALL